MKGYGDRMKKNKKIIFFGVLLFAFMLCIPGVKAKTRTSMYIESPQPNTVVGRNVIIGGWLMTDSNHPDIHIYVDNQELSVALNRFARGDVVNANPGFEKNQNNNQPGFNTMVDLSAYMDGNHILTINVVDSYTGEVLYQYSSYFTLQKSKTILHLETPAQQATWKNEAVVGGWLMSSNPYAQIEYYLNGKKVNATTTRGSRPDVLAAIKGYGDATTNPTPGFYSIFDIDDQKDGNYFLEVKIVDRNNGEVLTGDSRNVTVKKYDGNMTLESPKISTVGSHVTVGGWTLTENKDASLEIYVDDKKVDANIVRVDRPDVFQVMGNAYGGKATTAQPGFQATIDLTPFQSGNHVISVRAINPKTGEVICRSDKNIMLDLYQTHINLDLPKVTQVEDHAVKIDGWYLSAYRNNELKILIDGVEVTGNVSRWERPDVHAAMNQGYGGIDTNAKPGFTVDVDMKQYKDGEHTVKIMVINRDNQAVLKEVTRTFYLKKYESNLTVEQPTQNVKDTMTVSGWALANTKEKEIEIAIDDQKIDSEITYVERDDVHDVMNGGYGGITYTPKPGFYANIDMKQHKDGWHVLSVRLIDKNTQEIIISKNVKIYLKKYEGKIILNRPEPEQTVNRSMAISGWDVSNAVNKTTRVLIDGVLQNVELTRSESEDVIAAIGDNYGGLATNPKPFFRGTLNMEGFKDGKHTITIQTVDLITNDVIQSLDRTFYLKKYDGIVNLEAPHSNLLNEDVLFVGGWALSELPGSYIKVYVDGVDQNATMAYGPRPDVIASVPGYGGAATNPTPGFATNIDISKLSEGRHKLTIRWYSKLNELLDETTKEVVLYDNIYFGVDVSSYQKDINWQAVRNDGISFAIIRAGYRGYGTGEIAEDPKFYQNLIGARDAGIDIGVYFYSQAITVQEAIEEADFVVSRLNAYQAGGLVKLPIVIDTEFTGTNAGRADFLTTQQRTIIVKAFMDRITSYGYKPMVYSNKSFLELNLDMSQLPNYEVWLAHYTSKDDPLSHPSSYNGPYEIWQYTSEGTVAGISGVVDRNIAYKKY